MPKPLDASLIKETLKELQGEVGLGQVSCPQAASQTTLSL